MRRTSFVLAASVPALLSCSSGGGAPSDAGETFLAFGTSFSGYPAWESSPLASAEHPEDGGIPFDDAGCSAGHDTSTNRVGFLNKRPPAGSTEFPVGTIFVKEMQKDGVAPESWQIFAMVKRGGGYNPSGAKGWEWFELKRPVGSEAPMIVWRGVGPPLGEGYGSPACGGCNSCHGAAASNDYVMSPQFELKKLSGE